VPKLPLSATSRRALVAAVCAFIGACAAPEAPPLTPEQRGDRFAAPATVAFERYPSPNFDVRRPSLVVIHHTSDDRAEDALRTLTDPARKVSAHYLVTRDGRILHLVDDRLRAWHAGESYWAGIQDVNSASIGIELDNNGSEPFGEPLVTSLLRLLGDLESRFRIPLPNFVGHGDVAPGRKVDPSALFPWRRLAAAGYGLWCDPPYPTVPPGVDDALLLHALGYGVDNIDASIAAFKRHFVPDDVFPEMTEKDRAILYCLVQQKLAAP
jgi:N-acetylmuramoyl-L-alanine amidase